MKIENSFTIALPPPEAWRVLLDIPAIAPCMPGAELLAVEDDRTYKGQVKVKLGPVVVAFQGKAHFADLDEAAHTARMVASGVEIKGRGNASANVLFRLSPIDGGTRVEITTDVTLAGAVAQYGRAQGVIAGVAQVLVDQFAANLQKHLALGAPSNPASEASAPSKAEQFRPVKSISLLSLIFAYFRNMFARLLKGGSNGAA